MSAWEFGGKLLGIIWPPPDCRTAAVFTNEEALAGFASFIFFNTVINVPKSGRFAGSDA